jgi:hypothetical protein
MKAIISRYYEETVNPCFKGRANAKRYWGIHPPFWCICRPDYREKLSKNDYVFFVRKQDENRRGHARFCTGVLRVREKLTKQQASRRFGRRWLHSFNEQENSHKGIYSEKRDWRNNILVGTRHSSFWLGRGGLDLKRDCGIAANYGDRVIREVRKEEDIRRTVQILRRRKFRPFDDSESFRIGQKCGNCVRMPRSSPRC